MRILLFSGLLYLLGVGIILATKPSLMFTEDGGWKEFGIGGNPDRVTWFPFWLFTLLWAFVSFFIIQTLATMGFIPGAEWTTISEDQPSIAPVSNKKINKKVNNGPQELKPGYYMLNTEGTTAEGIPKYVYIGSPPDT